ncbi:MAG: AAA family ATPase, partial [Armatimonadota bacterium]
MWIESLTIRGFGCLARGRRFEFPRDRAMLIIGENERGKSTLAAAIVAGLCGFPQRKASGETIKMSNVYRPWDGGSYALEMEIEAGGTRLVVERDFDRDLFVVRDAATGRNVSAEFERDLAEQFLRLPRDDFRRIAFISGKDVSQFSSSANLRERLAAVADGTATDSGAETALSLLRDAKYPFEGSSIKPETAVKRISGVIEEKLRRMRELDAELEAASDQVRVLDELYARRRDLAHRSAQLDAEYFRARLAEVREKIAAVQADINERERLIRELKELEPYAAFPIERRSQLERSIDRQRDIARQIDEKLGVQQSLQSEADRLQVDIDGLKQFSLATDDDLVGLAASADALEEAESAVAAAQHTASVASGWRSRLAGRVLAAIGALCVIA